MTDARRQPNKTTKLAAALLARGDVPYAHAKLMTADQMISLYHFHHNIRHAEDGSDHFSNLEPMLIAAHKKRTAEIDVPEIAKNKDVRDKAQIHDAKIAFKLGDTAQGYALLADVQKQSNLRKSGLRSGGFRQHPTMVRGVDGKVKPRKERRR